MRAFIKRSIELNKIILLGIMTLGIFMAILGVINAVCLHLLIDCATGVSSESVTIVVVVVLILLLIEPILKGIYSYLKKKAINRVAIDFKKTTRFHLQNRSWGQNDRETIVAVMRGIDEDVEEVAQVVPETLVALLQGAIATVLALLYTTYISWQMTLIMVMGIMGCKLLMKRTRRSQGVAWWEKEINSCGFVISIVVGCYFVTIGEMTIGAVVGFIQVLNFSLWPSTGMLELLSELHIKKGLVRRLQTIDQSQIQTINHVQTLEVNQLEQDAVAIKKIQGQTVTIEQPKKIPSYEARYNRKNCDFELVIENVSFDYEETLPGVKNISLVLQKGKVNGMVGRSDCGKETLIQLILSRYKPAEGRIYIKNEDEILSGIEMRSLMTYVPQESLIIKGTIEENIRMDTLHASLEEIKAAAQRVYIHHMIESLPEGYQTLLDETGGELSRGQIKRIVIARGLLKNAPILILDNPMDELDSESEELVLQIIKQEAKRTVCLMIAQGKAAYISCERLIVMDKGKVIMDAHKDEIVDHKGRLKFR